LEKLGFFSGNWRRAIEKREMEHYIPEKREKKKLNKFLYDQKEEAKKHHGMPRAGYRDRWKVSIQVFMSFIVTDLII